MYLALSPGKSSSPAIRSNSRRANAQLAENTSGVEIVDKLNGVGPDDLTDEVIESFGGNEGDALKAIGGFKFGGGRQPKQPVPPR